MRDKLILVSLAVATSGASLAQLTDVRYDPNPLGSSVSKDGVVAGNEYGVGNNQQYLGGGGGFGGTVGAGALYMDMDASNLYVALQLGNNLNDNAVIFLDTRPGGFRDVDMNDTADPGRNLSSNLTRDSVDHFHPDFLPDYSLVIGSFGTVLFELNAGSSPGHLAFLQYDGTFTGNSSSLVREVIIPKAIINMEWASTFGLYGSDTNFMSNESIPNNGIAQNPGFGGQGDITWSKYNRFEAVPEPSALMALALGIGALAARRAKRRH